MLRSSLALLVNLHSRKILPAFLFLGVFIVGSVAFSVHSQSNETGDSLSLTTDSSPTPTPTPHTLVGTFYTTENNIEAKLLLNNKGITQLEVRPTLYNLQGQELQLPSVWVEPQNFRFINLRDWAMIGGDTFKSGSIKLFHVGKDLVLGSQIYLTDEAHSISYEEKLAEIGKFDSRRQEAVWQIPTAQTATVIALSNTSNAPLTVNGQLGKAPRISGVVNTFQLAVHETKVLDVRRDFSDGNQFVNSELMALSLTHNGASKDALLARVLVADPTRGFSNVVQFSNAAGGSSSEYQGVSFQIENINNQVLTPVIVARNVGTATATVSAKVPYTRTDGTKGTITLPTKQLAAGEIGALNVSSITQRVQQEQIKVASLEITYNTAAGSVIVAAHTVSTDKNLVFRVPMWDPLGQRSPTGGYPWRIENTSQTETYIKNITDQEQDYVAFLVWENGGMYMIGRKPIAGHETVHIDVKKIRDEQIPDERGRTVPTWLSSEQLQWTLRRKDSLPDDDARANLALIGRSEQVDIIKKIVNNYACVNCCTGNFTNGYLEAANPTQTFDALEVQSSRVYFAVEESETCYGGVYSTTSTKAVYNATWASSDSNIATVNSGGNVTGVNAGNVQISATWRAQDSFVNPCSPGGGGGGPQFAQSAEEEKQCDNENPDIKQEPSPIKETEDGKTDEPIDPPNLAACGSCQSHHFNFTASVNIPIKPIVKILLDGNDITSTSQNTNEQNVIVGQRINLTAQITGGASSTQQWTIPQKAIDKFETLDGAGLPDSGRTPVIGRPAPIPSNKLTSNQVDFIWHSGGGSDASKMVQYTATVNGISATANAQFDVKRPTSTISSVGGNTKVDNTPQLYLGGVGAGDVGITISRSNTNIPSPFSGSFQFVQLIGGQVIRRAVGGTNATTPLGGLDGCYPYALNTNNIEDTPGFNLVIPNPPRRPIVLEYGEYDGQWNTYLMFKPTGTGSDWVPIKRLDWAWHGSATLVPMSNPLQWTTNNISPPGNSTGTDTFDYPVWSQVQPNAGGPCVN